MSLGSLPSSLSSICIMVWEEMSFEEFQTAPVVAILANLAVLNLHVSLMSPTKFQPNPFYRFRADFVSRLLSRPPWWPSWLLERNRFSNSKTPCHPNASHQVCARSDLSFGSRHDLNNFKMATMGAILDIGTDFSNSKFLLCSDASHQVSAQSNLQFRRRCLLKIFKMAYMVGHLDIGTE